MTYMTFLGISGPAHDWFTSYISGRCQNVTVASQCSPAASLMCGVTQSSVLGSVELIMYMEDLVSVIDHLPPVSPHFCAQLLTSSSLMVLPRALEQCVRDVPCVNISLCHVYLFLSPSATSQDWQDT